MKYLSDAPSHEPQVRTNGAKSISYILNVPWIELVDRMNKISAMQKPHPLPSCKYFSKYKPCLESHVRTDSRGSKQISFNHDGQKVQVMTHVLSYCVANHTRINTSLKTKQVSHLCDHHWCHESSHIILESPKENHSRKNCKGYVWSKQYLDWIPVCNHNPPCLTIA